jgi:hypothetical protein
MGRVISYQERTDLLYVFVTGSNGHLLSNYWNGQRWNWADQGTPSGVPWVVFTEAITYRDPVDGKQHIYVFVVNQGQEALYVNYWNGEQWNCADQGVPLGTGNVPYLFAPSAVSFEDAGKQHIYVFVIGNTGHLYVNYWDGYQWKWADQGTPPGASISDISGVVTFRKDDRQRIYAFVIAASRLYVNYWNGYQWKWVDLGSPPGTTVRNPVGSVVFPEAGVEKLYTFVKADNDHLGVSYWNGTQWNWADLGAPTDAELLQPFGSGVVTYREQDRQRIYAFMTATTSFSLHGVLALKYWDGSHWIWTNQGGPPNQAKDVIGVTTFRDANDKQRIYAFVRDGSDGLWLNYWNGFEWQWVDQKLPVGIKIG